MSSVKENFKDEYVSRDVFAKECRDLIIRSRNLCEHAISESNLNIDDVNEVLLIGGSCRMEIIKDMLKEFFKNQTLKESINADEAVAYGATVRAAQILDKNQENEIVSNTSLDSSTIKISKTAAREIEFPSTMPIDQNAILVAGTECARKKEQLCINPDKMSSWDNIQEIQNASEKQIESEQKQIKLILKKKRKSKIRCNIL